MAMPLVGNLRNDRDATHALYFLSPRYQHPRSIRLHGLFLGIKKEKEELCKRYPGLQESPVDPNPLVFHYIGKCYYDQRKWEESEVYFRFAMDYYLPDSLFRQYVDSAIRE